MDFFYNLFLSILGSAVFESGRYFLFKMLFNNKSPYHYKKLIETFKIIAYTLRIWVIMSLFSFLQSVGLVKPLPKDSQMKLLLVLVVVLVVVVLVVYKIAEDKKNKKIS